MDDDDGDVKAKFFEFRITKIGVPVSPVIAVLL